jgi:hypothetical protein
MDKMRPLVRLLPRGSPVLLLVACGSTPKESLSFPDADITPVQTSKQGPDAAHVIAPVPTCALPEAESFDAGAAFTGYVQISATRSSMFPTGGVSAFFSPPPAEVAIGCRGAPIDQGGCCVVPSASFGTSFEDPAAGSIAVSSSSGARVSLTPGAGDTLYNAVGFGSWSAGDMLEAKATGGAFPGFDLSVVGPGAATAVQVTWSGEANVVRTDADLILTWTPGSDANLVNVFLYQEQGVAGCQSDSNAMFQLVFPYSIECNVASSAGTVTIQASLLEEALFGSGTGTLTVGSMNQTAMSLPSHDAVLLTASAPSTQFAVSFLPPSTSSGSR